MKNLLIIAMISLFGLTIVNAQNNVEIGLKGGINLSCITGDDVDSFDGRSCFHFGVMVEFIISESFSFQPELLYSCQGADYSETLNEFIETTIKSTLATFEGTIKADYLIIPLMAKYYMFEGFSLEAGPQVGLLISAKEEYDWDGDIGEEDIKEHLKGIDFGVNFGLGYKFEGGLNLGARYNLGLSDANDNPDFLGDSTYKNNVFQFSVGYFF